MVSTVGVISANPLFWQTKMTGSCQVAARFIPSWKEPVLVAPSPNEHGDDTVAPLLPGGQGQTDGYRYPGADDPSGEHEAHIGRGDVHGATLAARRPDRPAQDLADDLSERDSLADLVVYTPVRCHQTIVGPQCRTHSCAYRLLPAGRPDNTEELPAGESFAQAFVARRRQGHSGVQPACHIGVYRQILICCYSPSSSNYENFVSLQPAYLGSRPAFPRNRADRDVHITCRLPPLRPLARVVSTPCP